MHSEDGIIKLTVFNYPLVIFSITMQKENLKNDAEELPLDVTKNGSRVCKS